jgi:sortase B
MDKHNRKHSLFINRLSLIFAFLCIIIGVAIIAIPAVSFLNDYIENKKVDYLYKNSEKNLVSASQNDYILKAKKTNKPLKVQKVEKNQKYLIANKIMSKYKNLLKINKDIAGWITINNTKINYPVLYHNDNEYYLHKDIERKNSVYGSIFLDHRNNKNMADKNLLIYGHNMLDHSMFNNLVYFKQHSFFEKHRYIQIDNLYNKGLWEVFSVYIVDANKEMIPVNFKNNKDFLDYIKKCAKRSMYKVSTNLKENDRIATLVTCSYEINNARTIVQAKLVKRIR